MKKAKLTLSILFVICALSGCGGGGGGGPSATFSPIDPNANGNNAGGGALTPDVITSFETSTFDAVAFSTEAANGSFDNATFQ